MSTIGNFGYYFVISQSLQFLLKERFSALLTSVDPVGLRSLHAAAHLRRMSGRHGQLKYLGSVSTIWLAALLNSPLQPQFRSSRLLARRSRWFCWER